MAARWRERRRQKMQAETNGVEEIFIGQAVLGVEGVVLSQVEAER